MNMPSVMNHSFSQVPRADIPRSSFNRSSGYKTTFDSGYLVPVFRDLALPGDTFNLDANFFARLTTPLTPYMDNAYIDSFFFAVPIRLIWNNWQKFNGEQEDPGDSTDFLIPQMTSPAGGFTIGSMSDYLGIPTGVAGLKVNSWWHRAYNLVWNEWFRDQNLQNSLPVPKGDGPDAPTDFVLKRRGKRHDYFTSALPWPQKGPSVELPLGSQAPVYGSLGTWVSGSDVRGGHLFQGYRTGGTASDIAFGTIEKSSGAANSAYLRGKASKGNTNWADANATQQLSLGSKAQYESATGVGFLAAPPYADLSEATASTINQIRQAFQIQKLYERDARGGTRYTEIIKAHFGVTSPDARLQRPEYLGGGSTPINVHPVTQTSSTDGTSPQGNLAAFATASARNQGFTKSFTEHTLILGLISVRADLSYQQGLDRLFSVQTRWDLYWPALSHLGEQAVLNKEIFAQGTAADENVFGYQERFAEYRYKPSLITGKFRSQAADTLDIWHLAQKFDTLPTLSDTFIQDNPPFARVLAVENQPQFLLDAYFKMKCARPMPVYSVPGLIDHF